MTRSFWIPITLALALVLGAGCLAESEDEGATISALTVVPDTVRCVQVRVEQEAVVSDQRHDVSPGLEATIELSGLETGNGIVRANAFDSRCADVGRDESPSWVSEDVEIAVVRGRNTRVELVLVPYEAPSAGLHFLPELVAYDAGWQGGMFLGRDGRIRLVGQNGDGPISAFESSAYGEVTAVSVSHFDFYALFDGVPAHRSTMVTASPYDTGLSFVEGASTLPQPFRSIAQGIDFVCFRDAHGYVHCRGDGSHGALGDGTFGARTELGPVTLGETSELSCGIGHCCAVRRNDRTVACWGRNNMGQLADGGMVDHATPETVAGLPAIRSVAAGGNSSYALAFDGRIFVWGANESSQIGPTAAVNQRTAVELPPLPGVVQIEAAGSAACARTSAGEVWCWGDDTYGQLGNGGGDDVATPTRVEGVSGVRGLSAAFRGFCAFLDTGSTRCWGGNFHGELGVLGHDDVFEPTVPNGVD